MNITEDVIVTLKQEEMRGNTHGLVGERGHFGCPMVEHETAKIACSAKCNEVLQDICEMGVRKRF